MLEELMAFGSIFDWISPTLSIAGDIVNGGGTTFMIPQECGWTGGEIANLLKEHGVKTWGHMIVNGMFMITVRPAQAEFARYLLQRAGLPTGAQPGAHSQQRSTGARSQSDNLGDMLREVGNMRLW